MNAIDTAVWKLEQWFSEHISRSWAIKTVIPAAAHAPEKITPHAICNHKTVVMGTEYRKPKDKCTPYLIQPNLQFRRGNFIRPNNPTAYLLYLWYTINILHMHTTVFLKNARTIPVIWYFCLSWVVLWEIVQKHLSVNLTKFYKNHVEQGQCFTYQISNGKESNKPTVS